MEVEGWAVEEMGDVGRSIEDVEYWGKMKARNARKSCVAKKLAYLLKEQGEQYSIWLSPSICYCGLCRIVFDGNSKCKLKAYV